MIASVAHPLNSVKTLLADAVRRGDPELLAECLSGSHLPALGGDQHPAELVYQALILPPTNPELFEAVARQLATLCHSQAQELKKLLTGTAAMSVGQKVAASAMAPEPSPDDESFLFNLLLFATYLPADEGLFAALKELFDAGLQPNAFTAGMGRTPRQLRQALTVHQVDESLESFWFGLLGEPSPLLRLTAERKSDLLDAWAGLLWIPPSADDRASGRTPAVDRIERGLLALNTVAGRTPDGLSILRYALRQLDEAYPRSQEFWAELLGPRFASWPQLLRDVVAEQWPRLDHEAAEDVAMPEGDTAEAWKLLPAERREEIVAAARRCEPTAWRSLWGTLVFTAPPPGMPPQQWLGSLRHIRAVFEARYGELRERPATVTTNGVGSELPETTRSKPGRIDRLAAFERVTKSVTAIEERLEAGNLVLARRFLDDLIHDQEASATDPELIAKTLCNVAASAAAASEFEWAQALYKEARLRALGDPVPLNGLADVLKAQGRYDEAENLYREPTEQFPNDAVARNGLAEVLKAQERYAEAEALYRETAARFPNNAFARTGLADVLKAQERYAEAEELYRETAAQFPNNAVARTGLAEVLKAQELYAEAETLYREIAAQFPNDSFARTGLAGVRKAQGRYAEAETLYRETAAQFPKDAFARTGLADVLKAQERYAEAEALYHETAAQFPKNAAARNGLAEVLKAQERYAGAETLYRETVARFPNDTFARNGLAEVLKAQERYAEAEALYRETAAQFPNNAVARNGLAEVLKAQERYAEAETLYRETVAQFPNDAFARTGLAEVLKAQERYAEAETLYRETVAQFPKDAFARAGLADVLKAQERYAEAETLYRETAAQFPNNAVARNGLAEVLKAQERYAEAETLYRETVAQFRNNAFARSGLAEVLKAQERFAEAETLYRETVAQFRNNAFARNGLAEVLKAQERFAEAETLYRETVARFPNDTFARNGLAEVLKAQGRYADAEILYRETAVKFPNDRVTRHGFANLLRSCGRLAEALALIPDPSKIRGYHDLYDLHLRGMILLSMRESSVAIQAFKRGLGVARWSRHIPYFRHALAVARLREGRFLEAQRELSALAETTPEVEVLRSMPLPVSEKPPKRYSYTAAFPPAF